MTTCERCGATYGPEYKQCPKCVAEEMRQLSALGAGENLRPERQVDYVPQWVNMRHNSLVVACMAIGAVAFLAIVAGVFLYQSAEATLDHPDDLSLQDVNDLSDQINLGMELQQYGLIVFLLTLMVIVFVVVETLKAGLDRRA